MKKRVLCIALVLTFVLGACNSAEESVNPDLNTASPTATATETVAPTEEVLTTNDATTSAPTTTAPADSSLPEETVTANTSTAGPTETAPATSATANASTPTKTPSKTAAATKSPTKTSATTPAKTPTKTPAKTPSTSTTTVKFPSKLSWDTLFPIQNDGHATLTSSTAGGFGTETANNLFDGDLSTKLCTDTTGYTIVWKLDRAYPVGGYSVTTANDSRQYGRLPQGWKLEASKNGSSWTTVSTISASGMQQSNYTEYFYKFSKPDAYQYFRFTLTSPTSAQTQMSEITLYGTERSMIQNNDNTSAAESTYGKAGIALLKNTIEDYYDRASHAVHDKPTDTGASAVWPATSFVEALAEGYRLCPEDDLIYRTYVDVLNNALTAYKVNGTITTPSGTYNISYYNAVREGTGDYYYDDDAWICLQYLNAYTLLGDESYLRRAEEILEFLWTGWDDTLGGGIYWDKTFKSKNTCDNGPIATAFLSAYEMTGKSDYLNKGKQIYEWTRSKLMENNLYCDNIGVDGSVNHWKAAYNQGTMLTTGSLLYRITGESRYLTETRATYNATINHMFKVSGSDVSMNGNPIYKAWCIGWLQRGFILFQEVDNSSTTKATDYMNKVLDKTLKTKDANGYYDPYFCTGDWADQPKNEVLQPSGVACTLMLAAMYEDN